MPFLRVRANIVDKLQTRYAVFTHLVDKIPKNKNWFGVAVRLVNPLTLRAKSSSSALFLAFSSAIGDFVHSVVEIKESIFLTPDKITDRWVEHLKNTYLDYYGEEELAKIPWERQPAAESREEYQARLLEISNKLKNLFSPKSITFAELKRTIETFFTLKGAVVKIVEEPWLRVKPYPSASLYKPSKFANETDSDFETRLSLYRAYYNQNTFNTLYPPVLVENESLKVTGYNPTDLQNPNSDYLETPEVKKKRIDLLKNDLGMYTYLGESNKIYLSSKHFGSYIDVKISTGSDWVSFTGLDSYLKDVKPAGVVINYTVSGCVGEAKAPVQLAESLVSDKNNMKFYYQNQNSLSFSARLYLKNG